MPAATELDPTPTATGWILPLDPSEVRADVVRHVLDVADRAAQALGLPPVEVELFRECAAATPGGVVCPPFAVGRVAFCTSAMPDVIFICADLPTPDHFERVVAHEVRHLWQFATDDGSWDDPDDRERDATEYAADWLGPERYETTEASCPEDGVRTIEFDATLPKGFYVRTPDTTGYLRMVDPPEVSLDVAERALDAAERAATALDLPHEVVVVFYLPAEPDHPDAQGPSVHALANGFLIRSRPGHVAVRADLSLAQTEQVVVHELRHDWQHLHGLHETHTNEDLEKDAHRFDREWTEARV